MIRSAAFSATIITAAAVLAETSVGITEASTTRRAKETASQRRAAGGGGCGGCGRQFGGRQGLHEVEKKKKKKTLASLELKLVVRLT